MAAGYAAGCDSGCERWGDELADVAASRADPALGWEWWCIASLGRERARPAQDSDQLNLTAVYGNEYAGSRSIAAAP